MGLLSQIKTCGDMARKLRFLKEQMTKAGITPSTRTTMCPNINLDELEVCLFYLFVFKAHHGMLFSLYHFYCHCYHDSDCCHVFKKKKMEMERSNLVNSKLI